MISLTMLVKDPPIDRLALLLEYIRPVVGQVVIIADDRTSPESIDLMRLMGAGVYPFHWCDDFSAARNAALPHVVGDWTLWLDPDELPSAAMLDFLRMVDVSPWTDLAWGDTTYLAPRGYLFWRVNFTNGRPGEQNEAEWHCRLFRSGHGSWYRRVHELVLLDKRSEGATRGSPYLPKAPKAACLIHSQQGDRSSAQALYARLEVMP